MAEPPDLVSATAAIRLEDVRFSWRRSGFMLGVKRFAVERGERVFLVGESGSGKSTLLSLVCGIVKPDAGSVLLDGTDITRLGGPRRDRLRAEKVGLIFQMFNLLPYATPLDNVLLPLSFAPERRRRLGAPPREVALALLGALGLPERLVRQSAAAELSVGQQQRVAVARALIGEPPIIIADEPTSSLDASAQSAFLDLLFEQVARAGVTLLMVSHDQRLADRFDRSIRLEDFAVVTRGAA